MSLQSASRVFLVLTLACCAAVVSAQQKPVPTGQMSNPYGPPILLEAAKKVAQPAIAEARKNNWTMAVAIVDPAGDLVYFERMDNTQLGSVNTAINKARSAARFKRPTKAFQDMVAAGGEGLRALGLDGAMVVEGGIPLVMDGKIVGAIGASGGTSAQDGQCAKAAADLIK
jgi:glc operon protein GlcG